MKNTYIRALDAIEPDEQKKKETINKLIEYRNNDQINTISNTALNNHPLRLTFKKFMLSTKRGIAILTASFMLIIAISVGIPLGLNYGGNSNNSSDGGSSDQKQPGKLAAPTGLNLLFGVQFGWQVGVDETGYDVRIVDNNDESVVAEYSSPQGEKPSSCLLPELENGEYSLMVKAKDSSKKHRDSDWAKIHHTENSSPAPYIITTADELARFGKEVNRGDDKTGKIYTLGNDIDLDVAPYNTVAGWMPVGLWSPTWDNILGQTMARTFNGTFDGNGYKITGLYINNKQNRVGFFGTLGENAVIKNLCLEDVDITGYQYVGGITSIGTGKIINCFTTGVVQGSTDVGGLAGHYTGEIEGSHSTAMVSAEFWVGGLVGFFHAGGFLNGKGIKNSFFLGEVYGERIVGGIAGFASGTIENSYVVGSIYSSNVAGGIVGDTYYCAIKNCDFTGEIINEEQIAGGIVGDLRFSQVKDCRCLFTVNAVNIVGRMYWNFTDTISFVENCIIL